jgi:valyl-tRNA synthetase
MEGKEVLWLPGTDHAGIATQVVVEKKIKKEEKLSRHDLGREKFLERVWEWRNKHGGIIIDQLKKLGASCDWSRERFTMDPGYSRTISETFVDLFNKGLIYRGKRMVNWCPVTQTALSDEEVNMKPQNGTMYHFKVEVVEAPGTFLEIATTRPETIPGDTAVAVNPKDPRYARLIGKHVYRPLPREFPAEKKIMPIVADDHVEYEFGTGVLKVTPAHDKADFEIGLRHKLPVIDILTPDGKMTAEAGADLAGLDRFVARKKAMELMEAAGSLEKAEPYTNNVGFSERADVPIEPRLSEQWFLKYPSVEASTKCVATGEMKFFPDRWAKVYDHWMGGIQDWCISRQLWWGHRIPVWRKRVPHGGWNQSTGKWPEYLTLNLEALVDRKLTTEPTYDEVSFGGSSVPSVVRCSFGDGVWELEAVTESDLEAEALDQLGFTQDPDVLDTWFSSWLWPFATMGWTGDKDTDAKNPTLKAFYPTTDLVTGPDIIFFWVARMIMAGYEWMGDLPFRNVYFTGIIRDKQGRKMSKSLGNSPDPLDLIAKYGADALRFGVMRAAPLGQDVLFDEQTVELGRNFCNKLWNACRFRQMQGGATESEINPLLLTSDDKWILLRLDQAIREVTQAFADYKFSDATATLYRFFWSEYCDWYVEASKAAFYGTDEKLKANKLAVIDFVLGHQLRLFHPFLPFITEELWHGMGFSKDMPENQGGKTIMFATWPKPFTDEEKAYFQLDDAADKVAQAKYDLVVLGRTLKRDGGIDPAKRVKFVLRPSGELAAAEAETIRILLNAESLDVVDASWSPEKGTPMRANGLGELFLPLTGLIDFDAERVRLTKELEKIVAEIAKVEEKLANPNFAAKVPTKVLDEHKQRLVDWQAKKAQVETSLANLPH